MTTPANNPGGSSVGQGWTDTMSLATLNEAIRLNTPSTAQQSTNAQRFWSSPSRTADSTVHEVLQIDLANARLINRLSFDVATFPHDLYVEYYDSDAKAWGPLLDGTVQGTTPITHSVLDSVPAVLPPISAVTGHLHPQHSFSGHWRPLSFITKPITTRSLRIVFLRDAQGSVPVSTLGVPVAYSLGVRNLYIGYAIDQLDDIPRSMPDPNSTTRDDFAQTTDMFGSVVSFSVRVNSASNVLRENANTQNGLTTVWKSQPMPIPWAVINFYLDSRDTDGGGQVLDRIYVDPLYDGPSTNIYYSNDDPTNAFPAPSDPLPATVAVVNNAGGVTGDVLHSGLPGKGIIAFVDVNNQAVSFDASHQWWIGGRLNWKFAHGTQATNNPILSCSEFTLAQTPFGLRLATSYGDTLNVTLDPFDPATPMSWVATYDGTTLGLSVRVGLVDYSGTRAVTVPLKAGTPTLRFGGFLGDTPGIGNFDLQAFVLKIDDQPDTDTINDFLNDPAPYVTSSEFMGTNDPRTDNALLRYSPTFVTMDYPTGFIGGTPDRYADLIWTPIARDYVLRKGFMYFNPTKAKYWKLEFTNLSPQFYEVYQPVTRVVETFPSNMWDTTTKVAMSAVVQQQVSPGISQSYVVNAVTSTLDFGASSAMSTGVSSKNTPTQARVLTDASVRSKIGGTYWAWNFLPLHSTGTPPSFQAQGTHQYEVVNYQSSNKLAYFVGLRTVTAYRLDYLTTDDTAQVIEMFNDLSNVDPDTNWILEEDHWLSTGDAIWAEVRSKPINTNRILTGVQFAAQQTDAMQLLAVDSFSDPTLVSWDTIGDAVLTPVTSTNRTLGKTVQIDRSLPPLTWSQVQTAYTPWSSFELQGATFDAIVRGTQIGGDAGGIASKPVDTSYGGRLYAAARVIAPADLTSPLFVQIYDEDRNAVVMENSIDVTANKITEWYCGYTLQDNIDWQNNPFTWSDFTSDPPTEIMNDSFVRPNATTLGTMDSGQTWVGAVDNNGNELSLDIVSNKAVVTLEGQSDSVSTDSPWGSLEFTVGTMGSSSSVEVMIALIGTTFLDSNGVLQNAAGSTFSGTRGNVLTTNQSARAVQAGDVIRVDIMPTYLVPSGKADVSLAAGTDPAYVPYSLLFYLNGTWVRTFSHALGVTPVMGIKGRLSQQFTSFKWTPANYGRASGITIVGQPRLGNGTWMDPDTRSTWIDDDNHKWLVGNGSWDVTQVAPNATDSFTRTASSGWGSSDTGQTYALTLTSDGGPGAADTAVASGVATMKINAANNYKYMIMNGYSSVNATVSVTASVPFTDVLVGNVEIGGIFLRYQDGNNTYLVRPEILPNETIGMTIRKIIAGVETILATANPIPGLVWSSTTPIRIKADITGSVISGKVWLDGTTEPDWQLTFTETTITAAGGYGIRSGVGAGNTNVPITFSYDNLVVTGGSASDNIAAPLAAAANSSSFVVDTQAWHGSLHTYLRNIAGTAGQVGSAGWHGNVFVLDYDNGVYLDYLGRVVQNGTVMGTLFPSGLQVFANVSVHFVHTTTMARANWPAGITDSVTGSNVLTNPGFETDISGWFVTGGAVVQSTLHPHAGTHSIRVTPTGSASQCYLESADGAPVAVGAGDRVNVSGWVWCTNAVTTNFSLSVNWFDANDNYLSTSANQVSVPAATLTQVTNTFTAPAGAASATIVPMLSGTPAAGQVWYFDDAAMTVTHNTGVPNYPDFLMGKINGVVQGVLAIPAVATWTGKKRGLAGDVYSGTRSSAPSYMLDTAFQSVNWAPDATYVAVDATAPTWDNVTEFGGITYDDLNVDRQIDAPTLRARIVQKGASTDIWEVERLSLFLDPILWNFSNDGGYTWIPALDIRNNPDGVVLFPPTTSAVDINQKPGTSLLWKCTAYKPGVSISALTIRPWYGGMLSGITHRPGLVPTGPNVNNYDQYGDIYKDARFQTWNVPIPRDWWYQFQLIARSQASYAGPETAQITTDQILLSQTLITDPGES